MGGGGWGGGVAGRELKREESVWMGCQNVELPKITLLESWPCHADEA